MCCRVGATTIIQTIEPRILLVDVYNSIQFNYIPWRAMLRPLFGHGGCLSAGVGGRGRKEGREHH
jgi:hypothetical protein